MSIARAHLERIVELYQAGAVGAPEIKLYRLPTPIASASHAILEANSSFKSGETFGIVIDLSSVRTSGSPDGLSLAYL